MGLSTGIGIGIQFSRGGGQSWASYWVSQPEVLFFGLYSEISGGQMPNKVTGSSDYLTVAGAVGSETYQCPNTAPYIAADTDYIWFKTDETQRTVTTAELIGYDLQRTPVKYQDASPNEIVAIIILNAAVTGTKRNYLFRDMWLSVWWDDSFSDYGHVKDNRGAGQQLWTPEAVYTFYDTFTDDEDTLLPAHTADTGNIKWLQAGNYFAVKSNKAAAISAGGVAIAYFESSDTTPDISATLTIPASDNYNCGFVVRYKSATEHYRIIIRREAGADPEIRIYKYTTIVAQQAITHEAGDGILRCVVTGDNFDVYWRGIKIIDAYVSDGSYNTYSKHGLFSIIMGSYTVTPIDNFIIL